MNVLVVPMFALSRMSGPWNRAQSIAAAFERAGHHAVLGTADDGNCVNPCVSDTWQLPTPSPLGLPMALASRTFPLAEKLGISGRKPVRSFEEVLWLTGALAYKYDRASVISICDAATTHHIDAVYSEYNLPAIIAARALNLPLFGSFSYTTQASYASNPRKAQGVRNLLRELGLPNMESSLDLFDWLDRRFVPSIPELEPIEDDAVDFVGFLRQTPEIGNSKRDCIVVYLGAGSVPQRAIESTVEAAFHDFEGNVFVAGCQPESQEGNLHFAPRFNFQEYLPRARCFVHHGGQNSTADAFAYGTPQIIVPGRVFERIFNAESVERVGAGIKLDSFDSASIKTAYRRIAEDPSFVEASQTIRESLVAAGGAERIVSSVECAVNS